MLVLSEDSDKSRTLQSDYSKLWQTLKGMLSLLGLAKLDFNFTARKFDLKFETVQTCSVFEFGERKYDHLLLMAPRADKLTGDASAENIIKFVENGGNLVFAVNEDISRPVKSLASDFGFKVDSGKMVVDPASFDSNDDSKSNVVFDLSDNSFPAVSSPLNDQVLLYRGVGHRLDEENPLCFSVLVGSKSTFTWPLGKKSPKLEDSKVSKLSDGDLSIISLSQTRENSRVLFTGSLEMFSDRYVLFITLCFYLTQSSPLSRFFNAQVNRMNIEGKAKTYTKSGNEAYINQLLMWTFQEKSVIRAKSFFHRKVNGDLQPSVYRIKDEIEFGIELEQYNQDGSWKAFDIPTNDKIQFEAVMLDPYIRVNMLTNGTGKYITPPGLMLPDHHGVFTLKCEYKRRGLSYVKVKDVVTVRHFHHNEYPRFLTGAYPYYAIAFNSMAAFLFLALLILFANAKSTIKSKSD